MDKIIKYIIIELSILALILVFTKNDLMFHLSEEEPLTQELIENARELSYNQLYTLDHDMRYLIYIENEDATIQASLLWPLEPFSKLFVLATHQGEELEEQTQFSGRLLRCIYKCLPKDMYIEMFPFVEILEKQYPDLKGKYSKLPAYVLDTGTQPGGISEYMRAYRWYWYFYSLCLILGSFLLVRSLIIDR